MPRRIPVREPIPYNTPDGGVMMLGTAHMIDTCCSWFPHHPSGGLTSADILMLEDIREKVNAAKDGMIELSDSEYAHLKRKSEECRWGLYGPGVATFLRDVRDATG